MTDFDIASLRKIAEAATQGAKAVLALMQELAGGENPPSFDDRR